MPLVEFEQLNDLFEILGESRKVQQVYSSLRFEENFEVPHLSQGCSFISAEKAIHGLQMYLSDYMTAIKLPQEVLDGREIDNWEGEIHAFLDSEDPYLWCENYDFLLIRSDLTYSVRISEVFKDR
tara:strand:- start:1247 stop:1621 length:375 start_codon:yes stop_codon:yes gene_type:complete